MGYVLNLRQSIGSQQLIVVGAAAVVLKQQQLLLVKRTDNLLWGLPAGSKELTEDLQTTAIRELNEETGLVGQDPKLLTVVSGVGMQYTYPNGDQIDSVTTVYQLTATGELRADQDETSLAKFFSLAELPPTLTPITQRILNQLRITTNL
ncbi:NUDIX domain-containing protein [Levilactobacillus sp. N40-8-2]|uniref:NUDIX domain-containing protein n=1 Tax=Levilactobacillus muriae TaxID=3238987 RepID=UPI0038B3BDB8